ncbi:hypothetical protein INQ45_06610 [Flavobacterium columnare]|uniref:hypothetical protein n=1 Tax=Flavobacterium columnare TaxID=996 RepID=UPI002D213C72|nr:hypothetical protein [Flavobacterium columnare]MEB3800751.1 hypothetical protein [Flavobacterium columnare]
MSSKVLFIFEGPKLEKLITDNLTQFFVNENTVITCAYCTTIYKMYSEISEDEDLDTFNLLKDMEINKEKLKDFKRSDFAQIYMFFDYDGHATNASDEKIKKLLEFFNEETEKGKLYISYPMVEAFKHIEDFDAFEELKVPCKENIDYKRIVRQKGLESLKHIINYEIDNWSELINAHLKKMNKIVHNSYIFPNDIIEQIIIFDNQLTKYINLDKTVGVLSAFPVFLHDYYGNEEIKKRIE